MKSVRRSSSRPRRRNTREPFSMNFFSSSNIVSRRDSSIQSKPSRRRRVPPTIRCFQCVEENARSTFVASSSSSDQMRLFSVYQHTRLARRSFVVINTEQRHPSVFFFRFSGCSSPCESFRSESLSRIDRSLSSTVSLLRQLPFLLIPKRMMLGMINTWICLERRRRSMKQFFLK